MATLIILIIVLLELEGCLGRRFYCRPQNGPIVPVGRSTHIRQPDYLVFEEDLKPEPPNSQWRMCQWVLDALAPRQVALKVILRSSLSDWEQSRSIRPHSDYKCQLSGLTSNKCENQVEKNISLSLNTFLLFSMNTRDQLTLSKKLPSERPLLSIAVSPMEPGYCAQDMVLYGGKCHLVIEQQNSSLTEAMQIISSSSSAGLQLASFNSLEEIKTFIKTNYEPEDDLPPKQPLDLTKPVRIGLFYSKSNNSVFECIKTDNGCEMRKLRNSDEFVSAAKSLDGACGALQAMNSELAVIQFLSCDHLMPSLINFPETPQNTTCTDCNQKINKWLGDETQQDPGNKLNIASQIMDKRLGDEKHQALPSQINLTMVVIIASTGLALLAVSGLIFVILNRNRKKSKSKSKSSSMDHISKNENPPLIINLLDEQCSTANSQLPSRNSSSASRSSSDSTTPLIVSKVQSKAEVADMPAIILEDESRCTDSEIRS